MKLTTVLPALLLSLLTAACATAPDDADDIDSAAFGAGEIVSCDDASAALYADLEQVYLDGGFQGVDPIRGQDGVIDPLLVSADRGWYVEPLRNAEPDTDALCACLTDDCVVDWIADTMGCDLCVQVQCDGGGVGGCVPCETTDEPAAASCVFADPTLSALE